MEEKYKRFLEFNWVDCKEWHSYFENIYPIPPGNRVERYKRKFYQRNIDPDFNIDYEPEAQQSQGGFSSSSPAGSYEDYIRTPTGYNSPILAYLETFLWLQFLLSIVIQFHPHKIAAAALLLRVIRRIGRPHFTIEYASQVFLDEHFQQILYALLFLIDRMNYFIFLPLVITSVLNIFENIRGLNSLSFLRPYCNKVMNHRVELAGVRSDVEIAIGFLLMGGIFIGLNSFLLPIFYWQYLRFKYIVNNDTKQSFSKMNQHIDRLKAYRFVPGPLRWVLTQIQNIGEYLGRTEQAPGQGAGGQNCTIF